MPRSCLIRISTSKARNPWRHVVADGGAETTSRDFDQAGIVEWAPGSLHSMIIIPILVTLLALALLALAPVAGLEHIEPEYEWCGPADYVSHHVDEGVHVYGFVWGEDSEPVWIHVDDAGRIQSVGARSHYFLQSWDRQDLRIIRDEGKEKAVITFLTPSHTPSARGTLLDAWGLWIFVFSAFGGVLVMASFIVLRPRCKIIHPTPSTTSR